jgi:hypothetical protein
MAFAVGVASSNLLCIDCSLFFRYNLFSFGLEVLMMDEKIQVYFVRRVEELVEISLSDWISQSEAGRVLGLSLPGVRSVLDSGSLPTVFYNHKRGTLRSAVQEYLERRK